MYKWVFHIMLPDCFIFLTSAILMFHSGVHWHIQIIVIICQENQELSTTRKNVVSPSDTDSVMIMKGNKWRENQETFQSQIVGQSLTWIRTAWWSGTSAGLSSDSAPAPPPGLPALPSLCSRAQGRFGLDLFCCAVCPLDTLCCRNARTPLHSLQCAREEIDTRGQSVSPLRAAAASTPCSGCWKKCNHFLIINCICLNKDIANIESSKTYP